jgi:hypothetical protein
MVNTDLNLMLRRYLARGPEEYGKSKSKIAYHKIPLHPPLQKGERSSPPFGFFFLPEAGKGRLGGIFKALNCCR